MGAVSPLPPPTGPWVQPTGKPTTEFGLWAKTLDAQTLALFQALLTKASDAEAVAGVEDTHYMTAKKVAEAIAALTPAPPTAIFSKEYISAQQTITTGGALTLAHGLGVIPKLYTVQVVCQVAEGGYSIGDVTVPLASLPAIVPDATNLVIRYNTGSPSLANKSTGAGFITTAANWKAVFSAWA